MSRWQPTSQTCSTCGHKDEKEEGLVCPHLAVFSLRR
ncbi:MAG: hypothetical protein F4099_08470 [Synechococcus sp. SB0673_bin_10]|nr:hypothetical protein [Synechococcus sp. SB0673_bin_10]